MTADQKIANIVAGMHKINVGDTDGYDIFLQSCGEMVRVLWEMGGGDPGNLSEVREQEVIEVIDMALNDKRP